MASDVCSFVRSYVLHTHDREYDIILVIILVKKISVCMCVCVTLNDIDHSKAIHTHAYIRMYGSTHAGMNMHNKL